MLPDFINSTENDLGPRRPRGNKIVSFIQYRYPRSKTNLICKWNFYSPCRTTQPNDIRCSVPRYTHNLQMRCLEACWRHSPSWWMWLAGCLSTDSTPRLPDHSDLSKTVAHDVNAGRRHLPRRSQSRPGFRHSSDTSPRHSAKIDTMLFSRNRNHWNTFVRLGIFLQ